MKNHNNKRTKTRVLFLLFFQKLKHFSINYFMFKGCLYEKKFMEAFDGFGGCIFYFSNRRR